MLRNRPLDISRGLLLALGTRFFLHYADRLPRTGSVLIVSNHRSFMDAPLLMAALGRPIRFACHHYMSQVPVMREFVEMLGCFPLDAPHQRQQNFFHTATRFLQVQQAVGIFPEGATPMVQFTEAEGMGDFQRGFAHLALRAPVTDLAVVPVAIAPTQEQVNAAVPLRLLSLFDPTEPLFAQEGWHPLVLYHRVNILIGRPRWISPAHREQYRGKGAKTVVSDLTHYCQSEVHRLLMQGCD